MKSEVFENMKALGLLVLAVFGGVFGGIFGGMIFVSVMDIVFGNGETAIKIWSNL